MKPWAILGFYILAFILGFLCGFVATVIFLGT